MRVSSEYSSLILLQHVHGVNRKFCRDTSKKVLSPKILPSVATLTQFGATSVVKKHLALKNGIFKK
eukprot:UN14197